MLVCDSHTLNGIYLIKRIIYFAKKKLFVRLYRRRSSRLSNAGKNNNNNNSNNNNKTDVVNLAKCQQTIDHLLES